MRGGHAEDEESDNGQAQKEDRRMMAWYLKEGLDAGA